MILRKNQMILRKFRLILRKNQMISPKYFRFSTWKIKNCHVATKLEVRR